MHQFPFYTAKTNTDSLCFTYRSIMESNLIEYVEQFGVNVKNLEHIYLFFLHQIPFLSDKCTN